MMAMIWHSLYALYLLTSGALDQHNSEEEIKKLKIVINIYLLVVILFHCPIVLLQAYS